MAIPGKRTSAWLALQLWMKEQGLSADDLEVDVVMFDQIIPKVLAGEYDAGLIIHEGQLTYAQAGLELVVDLGQWARRVGLQRAPIHRPSVLLGRPALDRRSPRR